MSKKERLKPMTSPAGESVWAKVNTSVDVFDGKEIGYTISLKLNKIDTEKFIRQITAEFEAGKLKEEYVGKKWSAEPNLPYKEDKDGNILFKFSTKHTYVDKQDETQKKVVRYFDSLNRPISDAATIAIGNGSVVKVSFTPNTYWINAKNNGIKLFLNAIQILDLKVYGGATGDGSTFGFESNEDTDEDPFAD